MPFDHSLGGDGNPTGLFEISDPQDQEIGEFKVVKECRVSNLKAPKL